ncbi:glycoside hydrolase family 127 protein [Streptomyces sp. ME19-01-6]|nr:beta-L-arabinofuranosidase domain-containing protein [Streptomyces sp. ME19-01-6]MDX3227698.1 glycoside hydrolase family 127 protein [Streptomyces sp. ME19-01-6]
MQRVLQTEFGGMNEVLADLHAITGDTRWLRVAERFTHARVFDPLARNEDQLAGLHANTQIPKMVGALRLWEQGLAGRYRTIGENFWKIVTDHHTYVIGGNSTARRSTSRTPSPPSCRTPVARTATATTCASSPG